MRLRQSPVFLLAVMLAAAFAVHELRYQLAFGEHAGDVLGQQGHGYLNALAPLIVLLLVSGISQLLHVALSGKQHRAQRASLPRTWLLASAALVAVFTGQELIEGVLAAGHPPGLGGVAGAGGWIALPLAVSFGLLVAFAVRQVQDVIATRQRRRPVLAYIPMASPQQPVWASAERIESRSGVLARHLAGRAPPLAVG